MRCRKTAFAMSCSFVLYMGLKNVGHQSGCLHLSGDPVAEGGWRIGDWPASDGWSVVGMLGFKVLAQRRKALDGGFAQQRHFALATGLALPPVNAGTWRQNVDARGKLALDHGIGQVLSTVLIRARATAQGDCCR